MKTSIRLSDNIEKHLFEIKKYKNDVSNGMISRNDSTSDAISFSIELTYQLLIQPFKFDEKNNYEEMLSAYTNIEL